jgi:hypothetical protein
VKAELLLSGEDVPPSWLLTRYSSLGDRSIVGREAPVWLDEVVWKMAHRKVRLGVVVVSN